MRDKDGYAEQEGYEPVIPERYKDDFSDFEPLTLEREERDALAGLQKLAAEHSFEYGRVKTENGFSEEFTSEKYDQVGIPTEFRTARRLDLYHSHTNVTPLSTQDFGLLTRENVNSVSVITKNGDVYKASIGNGWRPTEDEFKEAADMIRRQVDTDMIMSPEAEMWTPEELNYMSIREQAFRLAMNFGWHLEGGKL